jgi:hypothetical protein
LGLFKPGRLSRRKEDAISACAEESLSDASGVEPANEERDGMDETGEEDEDASFCQRDAEVN